MADYRDSSLSIEARLDDLLDRMTLDEMIMQTDQYFSSDFTTRNAIEEVQSLDMSKLKALLHGDSCGSIQARGVTARLSNQMQRYAVEETRLGIPILFCEEALHGYALNRATCFPQQLGLAATFNPSLGYRMGKAIAAEASAVGVRETWNPVLDLGREPRYGRTEETFGEDTFLGREFGRSVVQGMQGDDLTKPDAVASEPKHYAGYGTPTAGINCAPCAVPKREVYSDALPIFEAAIAEAGAVDVMCSYTAIDGIPVAADHELLTDVLRDQWGMRGFVRTDLTAAARLYDNHYVAPSRKEAIAMALEAGVDLQLYDFPHDEWQNGIRELVQEGRLPMDVVRQAARRVLRVKFLLGLFDQPYTLDEDREAKVMHCQAHVDLAREIAQQSITLLKNQGSLLPLSRDVKTIAVLGPGAGEPVLGDYTNHGHDGVSVLEGIKNAVSPDTTVLYDKGCNFIGDAAIPFPPSELMNDEGGHGLTGRYYNNRTFSGEPVVVRNDHHINFNWIMSKPHPDLDAYCFSVLWTGKLVPKETYDGFIGFNTQDSMRLYVDGELIIDGWGDDRDAGIVVPFHYEAGKQYDLRIEFTNDQRGARVEFGSVRRKEDFTTAIQYAKQADVVILCVGDSRDTSGENFERVSLDLPGNQEAFVRAVAATGTPIVLLLQTGRPASITWEQEHIPAIVEAWFPGEMGGHAVADVLFGLVEPSGRLPITFPRHVGQIPCHYTRRPGGGRRYVDMDWLPLYPFGYGLGYTTFEYGGLRLSKDSIAPGRSIDATFTVKNTGDRAGIAVPQVYIRDVFSSTVKPLMALCGFDRVNLQPGEEKEITLTIDPKSMRTLGPDYVWRVESGEFRIILAYDAEHPIEEKVFMVE